MRHRLSEFSTSGGAIVTGSVKTPSFLASLSAASTILAAALAAAPMAADITASICRGVGLCDRQGNAELGGVCWSSGARTSGIEPLLLDLSSTPGAALDTFIPVYFAHVNPWAVSWLLYILAHDLAA